MAQDPEFLHILLTELHEAIRSRGWRGEDVLDLANVIVARGAVPTAGNLGPLTARMRGANGLKVAQVRVMAEEALDAAHKRAGLLARASGRASGRSAPTQTPAKAPNKSGLTLESVLAMKVTINDRAALERLTAAGMTRYLAAHGWRLEREIRFGDDPDDKPARGGEWVKGSGAKRTLLRVPADHVADRTLRIFDLLDGLEKAERRGQLRIYRDLLAATKDAAD